jgi:hypothetical protein
MKILELTENESLQLLITVSKDIKEIEKLKKYQNRTNVDKLNEIIMPLKSVRGKLFKSLDIDPNDHL